MTPSEQADFSGPDLVELWVDEVGAFDAPACTSGTFGTGSTASSGSCPFACASSATTLSTAGSSGSC